MIDFWRSCPYRLLERSEDGLRVSDDFLRHLLSWPELAPDEDSCSSERGLHAQLIEEPRARVTRQQIQLIANPDARENWQVWLDFHECLLRAPTLEAAYSALFAGKEVTVPLVFINQLVQTILRGILDGCEDALELRAAELFFRAQKISLHNSAVLAADLALVEGKAMGNLGRWLTERGAPVKSIELEVLEDKNAQSYFARDERHDMVLAINGIGGLALARVMEKWIAHFHKAKVTIIPVPKIAGDNWVWHLGLDAEASRLLNDLYRGIEVPADDLVRLLALFTLNFAQASDARAELDGRPVYLGLAMSQDNVLRLKPQNLLTNLPLARRA